MAKRLTEKQIKEVITLYNNGKSYPEISEITGVTRISISRHIANYKKGLPCAIKSKNDRKKDFVERIAKDRLTLSVSETAKKHGISEMYVKVLTLKHPNQANFYNPVRDYSKRNLNPTKKLGRPRTVVDNKKSKDASLEVMQKGHVKLQKGETILPTRIPKAQRSVPMYDSKNTIKFVDLDDPRSNEEIRSAWKEEQEKKLRSLAS